MKFWIAIVCLAVVASGCKKEESDLSKFNKTILGTWTLESNEIEYFSVSNNKEYEEVLDAEETFVDVTFSENLMATVTYPGGMLDSRYNLVYQQGTNFIEFYDLKLVESPYYNIAAKTDSTMRWQIKFTNIEYENELSSEILTAPYAILTLDLRREED